MISSTAPATTKSQESSVTHKVVVTSDSTVTTSASTTMMTGMSTTTTATAPSVMNNRNTNMTTSRNASSTTIGPNVVVPVFPSSTTVQKTVDLIQRIIEQITQNDAPAQNEVGSLDEYNNNAFLRYQPLRTPSSVQSNNNNNIHQSSMIRNYKPPFPTKQHPNDSLQSPSYIETKSTANSTISRGFAGGAGGGDNGYGVAVNSFDSESTTDSGIVQGPSSNNRTNNENIPYNQPTADLLYLQHTKSEGGHSVVSQLTCMDAPETIKMGHTTLVSLCLWTIDQIMQSTTADLNVQIRQNLRLGTDLEDDGGMNAIMTPSSASTTNSHVAEFHIANQNKNQKFLGRRMNQRPNNIPKSKATKNRMIRFFQWNGKNNKTKHVTGSTLYRLDEGGEEKKEESDYSSPMLRAPAPATKRLQLFGSEYARYLSTCQLAPNPKTTSTSGLLLSSSAPSPVIANNSSSPQGPNVIQSFKCTVPCADVRKSDNIGSTKSIPFLEDAPPEIQYGAVLDIVITENDTIPPRGYYRISQTSSGKPFRIPLSANPKRSSSANVSTGYYYLNVKKEPVWDKAAQRPCVTAITIVYPDRNEFVPPGFCVARVLSLPSATATTTKSTKGCSSSNKEVNVAAHAAVPVSGTNTGSGQPANLNRAACSNNPTSSSAGTGGNSSPSLTSTTATATTSDRIYLCFRRSREGNPITGIVPLSPYDQESVPIGYTVIERTPRNYAASLTSATNPNSSSNTSRTIRPYFLAYRQRLANLETLRPTPLVMAVQEHSYQSDRDAAPVSRYILNSYYCTGGTTIDAEIGRFHIMDRSTHNLLSPSSVSNRMNLIEISRRKARNQQISEELLERSSHHHAYKRSSSLTSHTTTIDNRSFCDYYDTAISTSNTNPDELLSTFSSPSGIGVPSAGGGATDSMVETSSRASTTGSVDGLSDCKTGMSITTHAPGNLSSLLMSNDGTIEATYVAQDPAMMERRKRLRAMNFIPPVEAAVNTNEAKRRLEFRTTTITPILTACYTRHGGAALLAVEGLTTLLTETDFFKDDVDLSDETDNESSRRLTLLDLSLQAVCDVATSGCQETTFAACVAFVERAVSMAQGQLNIRTVGIVLRFYIFIFYFDACIPRKTSSIAQSRWPPLSWRPISMADEDDFPMLYDVRVEEESTLTYLPGGAPQAAALALKDLISFSIVRLGKVSVTDLFLLRESISEGETSFAEYSTNLQDTTGASTTQSPANDTYGPLMNSILSSLITDAVDHVDRANFTQLAVHQIHRSGGSELFWHEMIEECGRGLFGNDTKLRETGRGVFIMVFAMLQQLVKISSGKLRSSTITNPTTNQNMMVALPKDIASKLLSLELLLHFLEFWSDEQEAVSSMESTTNNSIPSVTTLAFVVRRTVVPCLFWNTQAAIENAQVFRRVISILSELWGSPVYRTQCKVEVGKLIEHFALVILELGPQIPTSRHKTSSVLFTQQLELITEIKTWFSNDSNDVLELYLNYDTDLTNLTHGPMQLVSGSNLQLFQRICAGLSTIAEKCGEQIAEQILLTQRSVSTQRELSSELGFHGRRGSHNESYDPALVRESSKLVRKASIDAIAQIVKSLALCSAKASGQRYYKLLTSWTANVDTPEDDVELNISKTVDDDGDDEVIKYWRKAIAADQKQRGHHAAPSTQETLATAFNIAKTKSLRKSIDYLIACNILTPAPRDIASFLQIHSSQFNPTELGIYLSEGGITTAETDYWNSIRYQFVRASSFIGMTIEEGLRHFLTMSGFKLPGEAQRIDRMMNMFAQVYFEDNAGDNIKCPFQDHEVIYLVVFAMIMLNTDLHCVDHSSKKGRKKMSKAEFITNFRGAERNDIVSKEFLSRIYDSIENSPIIMKDTPSTNIENGKRSVQNMIANVRTIDSQLRGLAVHDFTFVGTQDFTRGNAGNTATNGNDALADLARSCVGKTWHYWYGVVNTCLETAHLDPHGIEPSVEILLYALCATICLNMPIERSAFLSQLNRLKAFEEHRQGRWVSAPTPTNGIGVGSKESWMEELEEACSGTIEQKLLAMKKIYRWVRSLQTALQGDAPNKVGMASAVTEIIDGVFLLQDPSRSYVRSGDLIKKSGRSGRQTEYRFYLFSDILLYASKQPNSETYKIHEELPLHLMKVVDWFPPTMSSTSGKDNSKASAGGGNNFFEIHHPRKRFQVICPSVEDRKLWVEDIRTAIATEIDRKVKIEQARLSIYNTPSFASSD